MMAGWSGFNKELNVVTMFHDGTSAQTQTSQIKVEESFMEMEGRGFSDFLRNSSDELFLKSIMETTVGMPTPTMEMLGFRNISHDFRTDSEELFKSWLTNGENNHDYNSTSLPHRPRQPSRWIMTEPSNLSNQQNGSLQKSTDMFSQNVPEFGEILNDPNQESIKTAADKGQQASNLYLAKAWFHSSQPMTRSRSSELRRRYAAMQSSQTYIGMEAMHNAAIPSTNKMKQEFSEPNGLGDASTEIPIQFSSFTSPTNSSSSTFNNQQIGYVDKVSSVVNMLKGTLERKKLSNKFDNEAMGFNFAQESQVNQCMEYGQGNQFNNIPGMFHEVSPAEMKDNMQFQTVQGNLGCELQGFMAPTNPSLLQTVSQEPSQSGSSAATPMISSGFDACDGPSNSCQTKSISESSVKQVGSSRMEETGVKAKDLRERIFDNLKDDKKTGNLVRYGSVTSVASEDKGNPTKKRRVERSRKMAEAKERNLTPAIPSDMQAILKRCENLEKEVRSLKLNLSFMNRKDSEQTKQIEELQKQNEEMADEKERLLEEIERIISETGNN